MIGTDFFFNGEKSVNKGVSIIKLSSGFLPSPFLPSKEIHEEYIKGRDKPYYYGSSKRPIQLKLVLSCLDNEWTFEKRREIARWLNTKDYVEFYTINEPFKKYYVQYVGGVNLTTQSSMHGYLEVTLRCDSAYAYSSIYQDEYECLDNETSIEFLNYGDCDLLPEIWISKVDNGDITIKNESHADVYDFKVTDLLHDEILYVNNENEQIITNIHDIYRYDKHNGTYLVLKRGNNKLTIVGKCKITFRYQNKIWG